MACVAKCTAVDDLEKADDCARKYYNLNKKLTTQTPITNNVVSDQEEVFYLDKIKTQSDSIARLKQRAQKMQIGFDKATIVNREMNKNKLQKYVDTQKNNIDIIMKRIQADKNKIETKVSIPINVINEIIMMIKNSENIEPEQKKALINKIVQTQIRESKNSATNNVISQTEYNQTLNNILNSCPEYDLSNLVKKTTVSDVCYGCDNP